MKRDAIRSSLGDSAKVLNETAEKCADAIAQAVEVLATSLDGGGKIIVCGNGISAADGQHMACSLMVRFNKDRACLPVVALGTNPVYMTAAANDYGFTRVFARAVEGLALAGDVFVGVSTSGNSTNVLEAATVARAKKAKIIGLTGKGGGKLKELADLNIIVPAESSPRIQEAHRAIVNVLCQQIEAKLFS